MPADASVSWAIADEFKWADRDGMIGIGKNDRIWKPPLFRSKSIFDAAHAFTSALDQERRKLELLLGLRLKELTSLPLRPLREIIDELGAEAERNGLSPEILDSRLYDE